MSKSREQLYDFLSRVDIDGKVVLDVGAQNHPASDRVHGKAREYYTNDIDEQWHPDILADLNDENFVANAITQLNNPKVHFDAIFCLEVLEHCWNPIQVIKNLTELLAPGGDLYISTPFINPHHDYWDYLRFTGEWYKKVLDIHGIAIVQIDERVATIGKPLLEQFYKAEGLKVSKIRPEYGHYSYPIGYFVHGRKNTITSKEASGSKDSKQSGRL